MKNIIIISIILLVVFSVYFSTTTKYETDVIKPTIRDTVVYADISAVGDLMCHSTQFNYAFVENDSFNFDPVYNYLKDYFVSPDLMIGNFETVIAKKKGKYKGYPYFDTPIDFLTSLKNNGFDLLFTANNHSLDQKEKGVIRTLNAFEESNIIPVGTFSSHEKKEEISICNINGIKFIFLAYSYGTNGVYIPEGKDYLINLIKKKKIKNDILKAKNLNPDIILVYYHTGIEYSRTISNKQKELVASTFNYGADIILASHPHVVLPVEKRALSNSKLDTGFVAYSLGNFISNQRWRYSDAGLILNFRISKNLQSENLVLDEVSYIPTWVFKGKIKNKREYVILPSEISLNQNPPQYLTETDSSLYFMRESYFDTKSMINKLDKSIKLLNVMDSSNSLKSYDEVIQSPIQNEYK